MTLKLGKFSKKVVMSESIIIAWITSISVIIGSIVTGLTNVWSARLQKQSTQSTSYPNTRWFAIIGGAVGLIIGLISIILLSDLFIVPNTTIPSADAQAFYDFENSSDLVDWSKDLQVEQTDVKFTGSHALKATIPVSVTTEGGLGITLKKDFTADMIIGRMFIPPVDTISINYAQICLISKQYEWPCENLPKQTGKWKTFVVKLSYAGNTLGQTPSDYSNDRFNGFVIILNTRGLTTNYPKQMYVYLDTIEIR
jgi:hypothetical protein